MAPPQPCFWPQSQTSYVRMYTRIGSFDFATKLKITPQNLIPGFGPFYRTTLLKESKSWKLLLTNFAPTKKAHKVAKKQEHFLKKKEDKLIASSITLAAVL